MLIFVFSVERNKNKINTWDTMFENEPSDTCAQRRLKSTCAQSDHGLRRLHEKPAPLVSQNVKAGLALRREHMWEGKSSDIATICVLSVNVWQPTSSDKSCSLYEVCVNSSKKDVSGRTSDVLTRPRVRSPMPIPVTSSKFGQKCMLKWPKSIIL